MLSSLQSVSQPTKRDHKIVVFGAAGHTGRFVVSELERRGIPSILAGRDAEKLARISKAYPASEIRVASVDNPVSLDRTLADSSLVINCAGPFLDTAGPIIDAALRARIHYLDVSAEQGVALAAFERVSEPARNASIVIVPSMAFYGGLGDLLAAAAMSDWTTVDEIRIGVALDSWKPTHGTRLTGDRNPGRRYVFSKGELSLIDDPPPKMPWIFPQPFGLQEVVAFPLTETVIISRHLRTPEICMYLNVAPLTELHDPRTPAPTVADDSGRSAQKFMMEVIVRKRGETRRAMAAGQDIYAFTAPLVVEAAERIIAGSELIGGTFAPSQIFEAKDFLERLPLEQLSFEPESVADLCF